MIQILLILVINSLVLIAWGKYLHHLDAFTADKKNENKLYWFIIIGGILNMVLVFIMYPVWESILYKLTGIISDSNPIIKHYLVVGPVEELTKFIVFIALSSAAKSIKEPRDGILQAASIALGFALCENFLYALNSGISVLLYRSFFATLGHMTYSVIWGFTWAAFVYTSDNKNKSPDRYYIIPSLMLTAFVHGTYNTLLSFNFYRLALFTDFLTLVLFYYIYRYVRDNSPYKKYSIKEYKLAIPSLKMGLQKFPDSYILNKRLGIFDLYTSNYAGAEKYLRKAKDLNIRSSWTKFYYGAACLLNGKEHEGLYFIQKSLKEMSGKNGDKAVSSLGKIIRKEEDKNKLMKFLYREGYRFEYKTTQMELRRRNALKKDRVLSIRGESMLVNQTEYMEYCLSPGGSQKG